MSSSLLKALKTIGLVQISDEEAAAVAAEPVPQVEPVSEQTGMPQHAVAADVHGEIAEQLPLEQIYSEGEVPPCPYPAEKLLRVLNGLRAMDANTRRAAVTAMDEADDSWAIEDVLLDVERKTKVLQARKQILLAQAQAAQAQASERVRERDRQQQEAVVSVRQQIAELQALMEREVEKATADKAASQAGGKAAQEACARETTRLDAEINRLQEIPDTFGTFGGHAQA
ncbi:MAG: hypothetical protein ABIQ70_12505 [Dokdonella sp.]